MPGPISRRELIRKFRSLGFAGPIAGKRHQFMKKEKLKVRIPNPHKKADVSQALLKEILRQARISSAEWDKA
jgi:predicted RNA binding protein YcfA (HicA-like mRNA interferase family)